MSLYNGSLALSFRIVAINTIFIILTCNLGHREKTFKKIIKIISKQVSICLHDFILILFHSYNYTKVWQLQQSISYSFNHNATYKKLRMVSHVKMSFHIWNIMITNKLFSYTNPNFRLWRGVCIFTCANKTLKILSKIFTHKLRKLHAWPCRIER